MGIRVRIGQFTAEHQRADAGVFKGDEERPERVDIWRDVVWCGQWAWVSEVGMGDVRSSTPYTKHIDGTLLGKIAHALRAKGV